MSTYNQNQITREMRVPQTDASLRLREEAKSCESCDRRTDEGLCLASRGLTWQEMSRMEPSVGGCGSQKVKFRPR